MKFPLGQIAITPGIQDILESEDGDTFNAEMVEFFARHSEGDWGDLSEDDRQTNEASINDGRRMSVYSLSNNVKVWLVTEWDRSSTCALLPSEY